MKYFIHLFAGLCLLSSVSAAAPVEVAPDLWYLRINSIVTERPAIADALHRFKAVILDLRYPVDERDAGEILNQEFGSQAAKPRVFVLVSPATPVPVVGVIAARDRPFLVTLGVKGAKPEPQVIVEQSAETDRAAYDALAAGIPLAQLISGKIEKERFDEAALVQEFKNGNHEAHPPVPVKTATPATASPAVPPTDRVLQRAIHLHRARLALRR